MKVCMLLIFALLLLCVPAMAQQAPAVGLVPPPAINTPYGGKVVTEINLSDTDILGILKQLIIAADDAAKNLSSSMDSNPNANADLKTKLAIAARVDLRDFVDAVSGVKNVRVIVVQYPSKVSAQTMLAQFEAGLAKTGTFSKILSDIAFFPGATGVYAEANNAGYVAFGYQSGERTLYAARVVGSVDIAKLTAWFGNVGMMCANMFCFETHGPTEIPQEIPEPATAPN